MAENEISDYIEVDADNTDIAGISVAENVMRPPAVNNAFRALQGALKRWFKTSLFRLRDSTDQTKLLALDLSAITPATTRTIAVPNKSGTFALTSDLTGLAARTDTRRNLIVNGSMAVSQENGNTLGTTNGYYPADQWALYFTTTGAGRSVQRIQARTLAGALDQIEYKCTTAKASLAAGDGETLTQNIEGSNPDFVAAQFGTANAKPFVLRKEVRLPAGTYHWHFQNAAGTRHCAVPFTIAGGEANTAVVKEIVVPADTSGTWLTGDGVIGLTVDLVLAVGATKTGGSASTWGSTAYLAASTQFNILSSTSNVARLADVGLKLDPDATGVHGAYEVGEVDAVYAAGRYGRGLVDFALGAANSAPRLGSAGVVASTTGKWAVAPTLAPGGVYAVNSGSAGTPNADPLLPATTDFISLYNSSANWTVNVVVRFTGFVNARLS